MDAKKKLERRRWLNQKDGNLPRPKSVDRGFISLQSPASIGATDEQASHDDLTRTASLEQGLDGHKLGQDLFREEPMQRAFITGFMNEIEKAAAEGGKPTFLDKAEGIVRTVGSKGAEGAGKYQGPVGKTWGALKGGYRGVKASFHKHPGMFLGPAAAYAGFELLKAISGRDKDRD